MDGSHYDIRHELTATHPAPGLDRVRREVLLTILAAGITLAVLLALDAAGLGAALSPALAAGG